MRLPKDRGITGLSIVRRQVLCVPNGEYSLNYAPEVDNIVGLPTIENCLIGPCVDSEGKLRGVIQLINKQSQQSISTQDEIEFESLLPTVAEMIRQVDAVKYVQDISANMNLRLTRSKESILNSAKVYEERNMSQIHASFAQIVHRLDNFSKQKQLNTFKENQLAASLLEGIRDDEKQKEK